MRRVLLTVLSFLAGAVIVLFIVSNRDMVTLRLWPFPSEMILPQWLHFLLGFALGLAVAWYLGVVRRIRSHTQRRQAEKRAAALEAERDDLEARVDEQAADAPISEPRPDVPLLAPDENKD